jgi:hypothetical protein
MKTNRLAVALLTAALFGTSGASMAADSNQSSGMPSSPMHGQSMMGGSMMGKGMMGKGMMDAGMMKGCPMMMHHLPPGNEKLEMQMHGEMMKAIGDIMLKYADQIQPQPSK